MFKFYRKFRMILNIFGPISIHTYGMCIATGVFIAIFLALKDIALQKIITKNDLFCLVNIAIIAGIIGGRLLYILVDEDALDNWLDAFALWDGGFSVLGSIVAIILCVGGYAFWHKIQLPYLFDLVGLYGPLIQAFGRMGCYFAGCCHGTPTTLPWGITYTDPLSYAPLCTRLHPTQLYNVIALAGLFFILKYLSKRNKLPSGSLFFLSMIGISFIRFFTDFWRGDRILISTIGGYWISGHQIISLGLMLFFCAGVIIIFVRKRKL